MGLSYRRGNLQDLQYGSIPVNVKTDATGGAGSNPVSATNLQ